MADQPKKKPASAKTTNDRRPNGKANKQGPDAYRGRKAYRGSHTTKSPQTALQAVLLGGGVLRNIARPIAGSSEGRWKAPLSVSRPFNLAQVEENKRLYPHLFTEK